MSERPWWFPTAVFVAPVCLTGIAVVWVFDARTDVSLWILMAVGVPLVLVPFVDLGRRESRAQRTGRLATPSAAALEAHGVYARWPVTWSVVVITSGVGLLGWLPRWSDGITVPEAIAPFVGVWAVWWGLQQLRS